LHNGGVRQNLQFAGLAALIALHGGYALPVEPLPQSPAPTKSQKLPRPQPLGRGPVLERDRATGELHSTTKDSSSAFGEGMATNSGYARTVRLWGRGSDPLAAPVIFETSTDNMAVANGVDYRVLDAMPAVIRKNRASTIEALQNSGVDKYDIPAFLRKQAD